MSHLLCRMCRCVGACVVCVRPPTQEEARRKNRSLQSALEALESEMTSPTPDPDRKTKLQIQVRNLERQRFGKYYLFQKYLKFNL